METEFFATSFKDGQGQIVMYGKTSLFFKKEKSMEINRNKSFIVFFEDHEGWTLLSLLNKYYEK